MRGPVPKDPRLRQRRNKVSTAARLLVEDLSSRKRTPSLPPRSLEWHMLTKRWWKSVWQSPMANEYLDADVKGRLYRLAILVDRFWLKPSITLDAEICRNEAGLGLTPIDRRRLQWEVERLEQAQKRPRRAAPDVDPREYLRVVK